MSYRRCLVSGLLVALLWLSWAGAGRADAPPARARLAVLVCFDQMRGDYLTRWDRLFGKDGFHRLEAEGTWFQNCHYPYAVTVTAAGHASIGTGCSPDEHGLIANNWYDRRAGQTIYCVGSERYQRVPPHPAGSPTGKAKKKKDQGISPESLLAPTLGDALKKATGGKGRVVSLSLKDRAAVLMAGQQPDACYWMDEGTGEFVTSTYYRQRLHPWVEAFNKSGFVEQWQGQEWTRLRPELDYERYSGPDDIIGEGKGVQQGRVFPHPFAASTEKKPQTYPNAVYTSPQGNDLLLALAEKAIAAEKLGSRDVPDLLCLSFSSNDAVGHVWGPDSQEVMDTTLRSDLVVQRLLACLDKHVGKGKYAIVVTADHGVCPLPEVSRGEGHSAERIVPEEIDSGVSRFLSEHFHLPAKAEPRWIESGEEPWIYFNHRLLREHGLKPAEVEEALAGWLRKQDGIAAAYTRTQLEAGPAADDRIGQMVRRSYYPERSGDVIVIVKPYFLLISYLTGTTHGTPHPYDTHVPLLVAGPGMAHALRSERITPQAVPVILAHALGISPPRKARAPLPEKLFTTTAR